MRDTIPLGFFCEKAGLTRQGVAHYKKKGLVVYARRGHLSIAPTIKAMRAHDEAFFKIADLLECYMFGRDLPPPPGAAYSDASNMYGIVPDKKNKIVTKYVMDPASVSPGVSLDVVWNTKVADLMKARENFTSDQDNFSNLCVDAMSVCKSGTARQKLSALQKIKKRVDMGAEYAALVPSFMKYGTMKVGALKKAYQEAGGNSTLADMIMLLFLRAVDESEIGIRGAMQSFINPVEIHTPEAPVFPTAEELPPLDEHGLICASATKSQGDRARSVFLARKAMREDMLHAGSVVYVDQAYEKFNEIVNEAKIKLLLLPNTLAPSLARMKDEAAIADRLREEVERVLIELAKGPREKVYTPDPKKTGHDKKTLHNFNT